MCDFDRRTVLWGGLQAGGNGNCRDRRLKPMSIIMYCVINTITLSLISFAQAVPPQGTGKDEGRLASPLTETVKSDFKERFLSEAAKATGASDNFGLLQSYLAEKENLEKQILADLNQSVAKAEDLEHQLRGIDNEIQKINLLISGHKDDDSVYDPMAIEMRMVGDIRNVDLVPLEQDRKARQPESVAARVEVDTHRVSLKNVQYDLTQCRELISTKLNVEKLRQDFKTTVSIIFAILVFVVFILFFGALLWLRDHDTGRSLMGNDGLQFVTLFVLIIAVIQFGILGILEGRELAAILSGISGYILGRGAERLLKSPDTPAGTPSAQSPTVMGTGQQSTGNGQQPPGGGTSGALAGTGAEQ